MKRLIASLIASLVLLAGCGDLLDPAAAVVNGKKITRDEIEQALERFEATAEFNRLTEGGSGEQIRREYQQGVLGQLIRRNVLRPAAEDRGISVTDKDIDEALDEIKADFPSEKDFDKAVAEQGLTLEQVREIVRDQLIEERLKEDVTKDLEVDPEEIEATYQENILDHTETRASHILVQDQKLAQRLSVELKKTPKKRLPATFAKLAKQHSEDKGSGAQGGDLEFGPAGRFVEPFENAMNALDLGEISEPVKSEFGFHIIYVTGRRTKPLEEVSAQIEGDLFTKLADVEWLEWVKEAYAKADIKVNSRYGELDPETQQIVNADADVVPGTETPAPTPTATPPQPVDG